MLDYQVLKDNNHHNNTIILYENNQLKNHLNIVLDHTEINAILNSL